MPLTQEQTLRLEELQQQRMALMLKFRDLTLLQHEIIEREDVVALQGNLNQRAELMDQVDTLHQELTLLMQLQQETVGPDAVLQQLVDEISRIDRDNGRLASQKTAALYQEIQRLSNSRRTLHTYSQDTAPTGPSMFDKTT